MTETAASTKPKFKSKKKLTLSTFKLEKGKMLYALVLGTIHQGVQRGEARKRPDGTNEEPPMLMHIINMDTGEHGQIMVAKIIETELTEQYPNHTYVGKAFGIEKGERKPGKRYDPYIIEEIEIPPELVEVSAEAVKEFAPKKEDAKAPDEKPVEDAKVADEAKPLPQLNARRR